MSDFESQERFLFKRWSNGDSAVPLITHLMEHGHLDEAAAVARLALADPECRDRKVLEEALVEISSPPDDWMDHLTDFARNPSEERWKELMTFVPPDVFYQRLRSTTEVLMRLGCDGDILFRCVSRLGMTPDLFTLASSGTVDPATIERRAEGSPSASAWLGLAAMAAFARGDRFNTTRYLKQATADERSAFYAWQAISEIRREADEAFNAELTKLGIPVV